MAIKPEIKKSWIELQQKSSEPVNAIGVKIHSQDYSTLKVWHEEGIDKFLKK